ncbi:hypothetical protein QTN47_21340 [Danxiaibacter flavus]|uniref:Lipoprotein n=1 Tax=Danxiaibacter flavus TaxID=3049108 RepID=A0ABV3ZJP2_9BACT|nr:hypothetical protein QNM32_21345 [Chitinophagaceae bacterium DXS]
MKLFRCLCMMIGFSLMNSCIEYRIIDKGYLTNDTKYLFTKFEFIGRHRTVYTGAIKRQEKIQEEIIYYTDKSLPPIKILFSYDDRKKINKKEFFVSVIDAQPEFMLTEEERQLLKIMNEKKLDGDYEKYHLISGFRKSTNNDNIPDDLKKI